MLSDSEGDQPPADPDERSPEVFAKVQEALSEAM